MKISRCTGVKWLNAIKVVQADTQGSASTLSAVWRRPLAKP